MRCPREGAKTRGGEWSEYGKQKQHKTMEEMKYEYKERGIGHVRDGESTRGDFVTVVSYNLSKTIII